jgi:hypothetical protein
LLLRVSAIVLCALLFAGLCAVRASAATILVIQSYHAEYAWDAEWLQTLRLRLTPEHTLLTFELDTKRLPREEFAARAGLAMDAYRRHAPDVVVLADDNACRLLGSQLVAAGARIIYMGVNGNPRDYGLHGPENVAGVIERPLVKRTLSYLSRLEGLTLRRALMLFDSGTTSQLIFRTVLRGAAEQNVMGIELQARIVGSWQQWREHVLSARGQGADILIIGLYQTLRDADGRVVPDDKVLRWTAEHSPVPCFAVWEFSVGPGLAIGGLLHSAEEQAHRAAGLVESMLAGEPLPVQPVLAEQGMLKFSRSGLARWGLVLPATFIDQVEMVP